MPPSQLHLIDRQDRDSLVAPLPLVGQLAADPYSFQQFDDGYVIVELALGDCRLHVELIEAVEDDSRWPRVQTVDPDRQDHADTVLDALNQKDPELLAWAGRTWLVVCVPWSR